MFLPILRVLGLIMHLILFISCQSSQCFYCSLMLWNLLLVLFMFYSPLVEIDWKKFDEWIIHFPLFEDVWISWTLFRFVIFVCVDVISPLISPYCIWLDRWFWSSNSRIEKIFYIAKNITNKIFLSFVLFITI